MKDDKLYLIHISECIEHIEAYVSRMDKEMDRFNHGDIRGI